MRIYFRVNRGVPENSAAELFGWVFCSIYTSAEKETNCNLHRIHHYQPIETWDAAWTTIMEDGLDYNLWLCQLKAGH